MALHSRIFLITLLPTTLYATASDETVTISSRCESIYRQKYLTLRLKQAIQLLKQLPPQTTRRLVNLDPAAFRHPAIMETVAAIHQQQSLDPLFRAWQSLVGFERVDDPLFAREFTELIFAMQRQLIQRASDESMPSKASVLHGVDALLNLEGTTYTEAMATRYYYAKRIEKSLYILKNIACPRTIFFEQNEQGAWVPTRFYTFTHPELCRCIEQMNQQDSLTPLRWLSDSFQRMKYLDDEPFVKEFLLLQMAVHYNIGMHGSGSRGALRDATQQEIANIYRANLNNLPIDKILEGINMLSQELPPLIEQYELNNPDLTWREWFQKNKWTIPLMIGQASLNVGWWLFQQKYAAQPQKHRGHHGV